MQRHQVQGKKINECLPVCPGLQLLFDTCHLCTISYHLHHPSLYWVTEDGNLLFKVNHRWLTQLKTKKSRST